ncbi:MAG: tRNA pseudouridine(55) synthase TruB [bacterium]|nr:tRNA pseudouridine(55) synthase TruB [bacterium]
MNWLGTAFDFQAGAILNMNKPVGKTSFWVVKQVRSMVNTKVGHAGTLDPFAEGVLLLCTGRATKQVSRLMKMPKIYVAEIRLGITTNTDDQTGEVVKQAPVPGVTHNELEKYLSEFTGEIEQVPPMFSAKKIQGKRLYKLARAGLVVERKPSTVYIEEISILNFQTELIKIRVKCSSGTYIRSLARDLGEKIGCGGHLHSLIRTSIGDYHNEDSLSVDQFSEIIINAAESS